MTSPEHPDRDLDGQNPDIDQPAPREIDEQPTEVLPEQDGPYHDEGAFDPDPAVASDAATRAAGMPAVAAPLDPVVEREYVNPEPAYVEREREVVAPVDDRVIVDDEPRGNGPLIAVILALLVIAAVVAALLMQDDDNDRSDDVDRDPPAQVAPEDTDPAPQPQEPVDEPEPSETPDEAPPTGGDTPAPPATPEPAPDTGTGTGGGTTGTPGTGTETPPAEPKPLTLAQIAKDPAAYKGKQFTGEVVQGDPVAPNAFMTKEGVLIVAGTPLDQAQQPGTRYEITGPVGIVDEAFRKRVGEEFFARQSYESLAGKAVIEVPGALIPCPDNKC